MNDSAGRLEASVRRLRAWVTILTVLVVAASATLFVRDRGGPQVIRTRGLIIEDALGRERILIGAPVPPAAHRVRTDTGRAARAWGSRYPKGDMTWYQNVSHEVNGLLILDADGFDRIAIGDPVPDPNIGKRAGAATGIAINDGQGFERTGYGLLKTDTGERVALGMDSSDGSEAVYVMLDDGGAPGIRMQDGERSIYLGGAPAGERLTGMAEPFLGLQLKEGERVTYEVNTARGKRKP